MPWPEIKYGVLSSDITRNSSLIYCISRPSLRSSYSSW